MLEQETAVLLKVQEQVPAAHPGRAHLVQLIGFCMDVPTVAVLLEECSGGDLLHELAHWPAAHGYPSLNSDSQRYLSQRQREHTASITGPSEEYSHQQPCLTMGQESPTDLAVEDLMIRLGWALQIAQALEALHSIGIAQYLTHPLCRC